MINQGEKPKSDETDSAEQIGALALRLSSDEQKFIPQFLRKRSLSLPNKAMRKLSLVEPIKVRSSSFRHSLKKMFRSEAQKEYQTPNYYLTSDQRSMYKISVKDGLYYNQAGALLQGTLLYILFPDDTLFATPDMRAHHSWLSSGLDVKGAGLMYVSNGVLMSVSNESGHYKLTVEEMLDALKWFVEQSQNPHLIFEDHSQQDKDKLYNNILFSLAKDTINPQAEGDIHLSIEQVLQQFNEAIDSIFCNKLESDHSEGDFSLAEYLGEDIGDGVYETPLEDIKVDDVKEDTVLRAPEVFSTSDYFRIKLFTCLPRILDQSNPLKSRFNANTTRFK